MTAGCLTMLVILQFVHGMFWTLHVAATTRSLAMEIILEIIDDMLLSLCLRADGGPLLDQTWCGWIDF